MARAWAVMPQVASRPIRPRTWSPCMCVMKMCETWLRLRSLRRSWCCVPSPQSKSQTSARCGGLKATHETLRARVGTPELVPRKVIRKVNPARVLDKPSCFPTDVLAALQPEAPGLERVRAGVGAAGGGPGGALCRRGRRPRLFNPDARARQVCAVEGAVNRERLAELARPGSQLAVFDDGPAASHPLDPFEGFDGAHQNCVRHIFRACDDVELVVHAVDEVDVCDAARAVHRLGARGAATAVGVRRAVFHAAVSLDLDDAARP